jgi:hypothetical protein
MNPYSQLTGGMQFNMASGLSPALSQNVNAPPDSFRNVYGVLGNL